MLRILVVFLARHGKALGKREMPEEGKKKEGDKEIEGVL